MNQDQVPRTYESVTGKKRLLRTHPKCSPTTFDDLLHCCAVTIEDSMLTSGGRPGVDYIFMDLFTLALPLARDFSRGGGSFGKFITTEVPDSHPSAGLTPTPGVPRTEPETLNDQVLGILKREPPLTIFEIKARLNRPPKRGALPKALHRLGKQGLVEFKFFDDGRGPRYRLTGEQ